MADVLRDWWWVWLCWAAFATVSEAVSARLIYWQREHIKQLKRAACNASGDREARDA